jgi:CubicO group peptidase (beta-lactamase class C family)
MKTTRAFVAATLVVAGGVVALPARASAQARPGKAEVARVVDSLARKFVADKAHGSPGVSIAVVRGSDTLVMKGWGMADLENDVPAAAQTVYRIGSITKQFTAAAVMQLVQDGKVKLDDSIGTYLPTLPAAWRVATVRQLLNHTSGIPSYTGIGERWVRRWGEEMPPDTLVALTANDTMWFAPGTSWRYDNSGYVVLGMLIEKLTGHSWATDLENRFFKPLGLTSTENCLTTPLIKHRAQGYEPTKDGWQNAQYLAMTQPYAAGALCSTVGDLAKWDRALGMGKVVTPASYAQMTTAEGAASRGRLQYGFGLSRDTLGGQQVIRHNGGINGFISDNAWFPDVQLSVTVLTNSGSARAGDLLNQVARAALGVPLVQPPKRVALSAAELERYVGTYVMMLGGQARDFTFSVKDGQLISQMEGQGPVPVIPYGNDTFGVGFDPNLRLVFTMAGDKATKVTLRQGGNTITGDRK